MISSTALPALRVNNITAGYGSLVILKSISLEVYSGETVTVFGANGAGKTTLLRVIAGIIQPRDGYVEILGSKTTGLPPNQIARLGVGHVPSGRELFSGLTVEDHLRLGARLARKDRRHELHQRVFDLFPSLLHLAHRRVGALSGGEQQMVAIGRALMTDPKILLLDEPSTGLAPKVVTSLFMALEVLIQANLTVLLVEQNVSMALSLANRGYLLDNGAIVLNGPANMLQKDERVINSYLGAGSDIPVDKR